MKTLSFQDFLNQKSISSHILIVSVSWLIAAIFLKDSLHLFFLLAIQIELFVLLGNRIFKGVETGSTRKEMTNTIISRLLTYLVLCFVIALIITILFRFIFDDYGLTEVIGNFLKYEFGGWVFGTVSGLILGAAIFLFIQWQSVLKSEQKLREENLIFQNETLKTQINPHFLFNSLNTLSSLINSQPEIAEEYINRFSSIYRYILENSSKYSIPLQAELSLIRDYFYLHKIRKDEKIQLDIKVYEPENYNILPVTLQGLIENAIKHNKASREDPLKIIIYIEGQYIVVKNNLQRMTTQIKSTGIGLKNLAERVKLISRKNLIIEETDSYFLVKIPLL